MGRQVARQIAKILRDDCDASRFESSVDCLNGAHRLRQMLKNLEGEDDIVVSPQGCLEIIDGLDTSLPKSIILESSYRKVIRFAPGHLIIIKLTSVFCQEERIVSRTISIHEYF